MKPIFPYMISFLLCTVPAVSSAYSESADIIYLKDGSVIRGTIVEEIPGESYKIEIAGGSIFFFGTDEVEKVVREVTAREEKGGTYSSFYKTASGYRSFLFGFAAIVGRFNALSGVTLYGGEFTVGWRFHPLYTGALGFGYNRARYDINWGWGSHDQTFNFVPLYIHNRITYFRTDVIGLYGKFNVGYGLVYYDDPAGEHGGLLYGFGQGFEFGLPRFHGDVAVELRNQSFGGTDPENEFITHFGFSM
jgi:hypothetical protein